MSTRLTDSDSPSTLTLESFHPNPETHRIRLHRLINAGGMSVALSNYGARIVSLIVPGSDGRLDDVVLGYDTHQDYLDSTERYYGATIGRVGNRIANGHFTLDGTSRKLLCNQPPNHLHGGVNGFHNVVWKITEADDQRVTFRHVARESNDGYPGDLTVEVCFTLNEEGELRIDYQAVSDKTTLVNLTNHAYFNLSGAGSGSVAKHLITLNAEAFTPVNAAMIPTGEVRSVAGTAFDLRKPIPMGMNWNSPDPQIQLAGGYDHNFVLRKSAFGALERAARVEDRSSGRILEVDTTEPGVQFYSANALSGLDIGREGVAYLPRTAFCLETQHYPDSPNHPQFPSIRLDAGDTYRSTTIYRFLSA